MEYAAAIDFKMGVLGENIQNMQIRSFLQNAETKAIFEAIIRADFDVNYSYEENNNIFDISANVEKFYLWMRAVLFPRAASGKAFFMPSPPHELEIAA